MEQIELICRKGKKEVSQIINRTEIKEKMQIALTKGWNCTAYQFGIYKKLKNE